jgi:Zn-dependent membrane protease YugP
VIKLIFYFLPFLSLFLPSIWVSYVLKKNNEILPDMPFTGKELGLKLLKENKLDNVLIEPIKQVDHYNPLEKKVRISEDKLNKKSITSIAVVAHEIGHAIQDKENYKPLLLRQKLVEKTIIFQRIGSFLLIIGLPSIFAITKVLSLHF